MKALAVAAVVLLCLLLAAQAGAGVTLSRRLAGAGWILHTRPNCSACTAQAAALGDPFYAPQVVDAAPSAFGHPYWVNARTGEVQAGLRLRPQLQKMAG